MSRFFDPAFRLLVIGSLTFLNWVQPLLLSAAPSPALDSPPAVASLPTRMAPETTVLTATLTIPPLPAPAQETKKETSVYLPILLAEGAETLLAVSSMTTTSLAFDGINDMVRTADLPALNSFTLETWVKRTADSGDYEVLLSDLDDAYSQMTLELFIDNGNDYCLGPEDQFVYAQMGNDIVQCSGVRAEVGRWYHLAVSRDSAGTQRFFVDGFLQAVETNAPALVDSNGLFIFGQAGAAPAYRFGGVLDEVRLSGSAVYTAPFVPPGEPLSSDGSTVGLWRLDEGSGQTAADSSGNGRDGTLGSSGSPDAADPAWSSETPVESSLLLPIFGAEPLTGTVPLTVTFINHSLRATGQSWAFGDGITSSLVSPTHLYTQAGVYTVSLVVSDGQVTQTLIRTRFISASWPIQVITLSVAASSDDAWYNDGDYDDTSPSHIFGEDGGETPEVLTMGWRFTEVAIPPGALIQSARVSLVKEEDHWVRWTFEWSAEAAGNPPAFSPANSPEDRSRTSATVLHQDDVLHQDGVRYPLDEIGSIVQAVVDRPDWASGNALVLLARSDWGGRGQKEWRTYDYSPADAAQLVIHYSLPLTTTPQAAFSASPLSGTQPLTVTFSNSSQYADSYLWNFGDGSTSTVISPTHAYTQAGIYTVTLTAGNGLGSASLPRTSYVTVADGLTTGFSAFPVSGPGPLTVQFLNNSSGAIGYHWTFGDGLITSLPSPTHTYTQTGVYTVSLTASDGQDSDTLTRTGYITVSEALMADFSANPLSGTIPLTVIFTNTSLGATGYLWEFGDGSAFIIPDSSFVYTYTTPGVYTISLTAGNGSLSQTLTRTHYITAGAIIRNWSLLTPTPLTSPPAVGEHGLAYDQRRGVAVLYGGNAAGWPYETTTWEFSGGKWLTTTTSGPDAHYGAEIAYDGATGEIILFGGSSQNDTALNQTWAYTNATWSQLAITGAIPAGRTHHSLASNPINGTVYLFGGNDGLTYFNDLWRYQAGIWTPLTPDGDTPQARTLAALTYDPDHNRLLLFGGRTVTGTVLADLWAFDIEDNNWNLLDGGGEGDPAARMAHSLTYDAATHSTVLIGGVAGDGQTRLSDIWHYQAGWSVVNPQTPLPARAYHDAIYADNAILLFSHKEGWKYE